MMGLDQGLLVGGEVCADFEEMDGEMAIAQYLNRLKEGGEIFAGMVGTDVEQQEIIRRNAMMRSEIWLCGTGQGLKQRFYGIGDDLDAIAPNPQNRSHILSRLLGNRDHSMGLL